MVVLKILRLRLKSPNPKYGNGLGTLTVTLSRPCMLPSARMGRVALGRGLCHQLAGKPAGTQVLT